MYIRFTQIIMERVPCRWCSDSEGVTAERVQQKLEQQEIAAGGMNEHTVA